VRFIFRLDSLNVRLLQITSYVSSSPGTSGGRLCFALRPAGLASSSGFERESGCPGGAVGLRILSNTGLTDFLSDLDEAAFLTIVEPFAFSGGIDASSQFRRVSMNKLMTRDRQRLVPRKSLHAAGRQPFWSF
jgi:hypothetical protein